MAVLNHLLVPTDFGEPAERALDLALTIAPKFGSKLTLLHVHFVALPPYGHGLYWPVAELEIEARKALDAALARSKERYTNVEGDLALGDPVHQILATAEKRGADMIIMGTHGRRGLLRVLLGSVAEKVVRLSPLPVVTVPAEELHSPEGTRPA